jgi:hypothetical protein
VRAPRAEREAQQQESGQGRDRVGHHEDAALHRAARVRRAEHADDGERSYLAQRATPAQPDID